MDARRKDDRRTWRRAEDEPGLAWGRDADGIVRAWADAEEDRRIADAERDVAARIMMARESRIAKVAAVVAILSALASMLVTVWALRALRALLGVR